MLKQELLNLFISKGKKGSGYRTPLHKGPSSKKEECSPDPRDSIA